MKLELKQIRLDGGTQPRAAILVEVVEDYAEQMQAGAQFPPVTVFFDGHEYWLADGFHRVHAARQLNPQGTIEAEVLQGTQSDSQWHSYGVNRTHGLRRSREDRLRAVKAALLHATGCRLSDRQIAEHVGVSHPTVAKVRSELESSGKIYQMPSRTVTRGKATYEQDTTNIGNRSKRRDPDQPSHHMASRIQPPTRLPNPMEKMTALTLPHNPVAAARALIEVFDVDYLRALADEIATHLEEIQQHEQLC